jgi:ribosomal protein S18 acetylase RimI-like enzyme
MSPADPGIAIEEVLVADPELHGALARLVPQLSSAPPPTAYELEDIVASAASRLLVARSRDEGIVGSLTLVIFRAPTGVRAWIEDVVVDERIARRGIGGALVRHALQMAATTGARSVDLTSRPAREAANRLYEREGFTRRDTNVWRYSFEE